MIKFIRHSFFRRRLASEPKHNPEVKFMKQVLLLGDSVRMQYQKTVAEKLADLAEVSGPDENGRWSGYTLNSLRFWLPQLPPPDLVQWNCGLWDMGDDYQEGRHFYPPDLYEEACHRICRILRKFTGKPDLPLVIATTTPTRKRC